ncbi:hypothetical protein EHQ58_16185 [Leptospira ognonensis]|uniref:Cys-rich protein n=1 Tax=Leptospira ognonensis TaxID=2484945 RepID=A0A4R9JV81_9LEPT|nr:hypothetical protein [Leptospira ognonensis]TGL56732.1 hypothetical protein EHQ58_16185 [Leptospira ognonensis]
MKKYGLVVFLLILVSLWDFSKDNFTRFGVKATGEQTNQCKILCEKVTSCLNEDQLKLQDPKLYHLACEILCTKQFQLFSECFKSIETSCEGGEACIKNQTRGLF